MLEICFANGKEVAKSLDFTKKDKERHMRGERGKGVSV